jgi:hypothetical protein
MQFATTTAFCVGVGVQALRDVTSGGGNVGIGFDAGASITTGHSNTCVGREAYRTGLTGVQNTCVGKDAGELATSSNNTLLGFGAGDNITSGANNIAIGSQIDAQSATASNTLTIQNIIFGTDNSGTGTTVSTGEIGIGETAPATKLHIDGAFSFNELSTDPSDPAEGTAALWMSDGTDSGDDGDIMMKITAGATTKTITLVDFSAA